MKLKPQEIAEAAIAIALAFVLSFIKIYELPMGGSVTAGSMVPLLILGMRRGCRLGFVACILYGVLQFIQEPYSVSPIQVILDYPIAFGLLGLAGFFMTRPIFGVFAGIAGRFLAHLLSGAIFFAQYAPKGMNPWIYSAAYNGSYLGIEFMVSAALVYVLIKQHILEIYR